MDYKEMTYEDIDRLQQEMNNLRKKRKIILLIAFIFLILFVVFFVLSFVFAFINDDLILIMIGLSGISFIGMVVFFIVAGVAFGGQLRSRNRLIMCAKQYIEMQRLAKKE